MLVRMPTRSVQRCTVVAVLACMTQGSCSLATSLDGLEGGGAGGTASAHDGGLPDAAPEAGGSSGAGGSGGASPCGADLLHDPAHCGACDHDCLGGDCVGGSCRPAVVVQGQASVAGIAVDTSHVYWVETSTKALKRAAVGDGQQQRLDVAADAVSDPFDVAVDATHLYWTERSGIEVRRKPLQGGDSEHVTWGLGACAYLAIDDGMLFVSDFRQDDPAQGSIVSSPVQGSDGALIYAQQPLAAGLHARDGELYWARTAPNGVMRGTYEGGVAARMLDATGAIGGLAFDGVWLYWLEDGRRVMRAQTASGVPVLVYDAGQDAELVDIASDALSVWWSDRGSGTILRLAK